MTETASEDEGVTIQSGPRAAAPQPGREAGSADAALLTEREMLLAANRHMELLYNVACAAVLSANVTAMAISADWNTRLAAYFIVGAAVFFAILNVAMIVTYGSNMEMRDRRRDAFDVYTQRLWAEPHPLGPASHEVSLQALVFGRGHRFKFFVKGLLGALVIGWVAMATVALYALGTNPPGTG